MFKEIAQNLLQSQYLYSNIASLAIEKAKVWNNYLGNIAQHFNDTVLNINNCEFDILVKYWGKILKTSPYFENNQGQKKTIPKSEFKNLILFRLFSNLWQGDAISINNFMQEIYKDRGEVYVDDKADKFGIIYIFNFPLSLSEKYIFLNKDVLPRPMGLSTSIIEIDQNTMFGFKGSNFQPLGQGVFFKGKL